jgi:hypothetical protein
MIVTIKYFHEKSQEDFDHYNKLWDENVERFIFLQINLTVKQQIHTIYRNIDDEKDILAIRFPDIHTIQRNSIFRDVILGKGITYDMDKIWYPKEVWVYNVCSNRELDNHQNKKFINKVILREKEWFH